MFRRIAIVAALAVAFPSAELLAETAEELTVRASTRFARGDLEGAKEDIAQAIKRDPKYAEAYLGRAALRLRSADLEGAISD